MTVEFESEFAADTTNGNILFACHVGQKRVSCAVTEEALWLRSPNQGVPAKQLFLAHRREIEEEFRRHLQSVSEVPSSVTLASKGFVHSAKEKG